MEQNESKTLESLKNSNLGLEKHLVDHQLVPTSSTPVSTTTVVQSEDEAEEQHHDEETELEDTLEIKKS